MKAQTCRSPTPGTGKTHECPTCGRRLVDKRSLKQHVAAAHPVSADATRCTALAARETT